MSGNTKTKELNVSSIFQSMTGIREEINHTWTGLQLNGMAIEAQIAQRKIQNGLTKPYLMSCCILQVTTQ